ncbi:MAG: DPP IV N-terminal domain-containing protein [Phycisphaeraceae bacterium]|nr:MAG: DPP IV N-terminal domain-containing protein [Phycisphaeraceae bacterium]
MTPTLTRLVSIAALVAGVLAAPGCASRGPSAPPASGAGADPALRNTEFLEQFALTYRFSAGTPRSITVTPDGSAVLFLRSGPRSVVQNLYEFDTATGAERVVLTADQILRGGEETLSAEELARRERLRMTSRGIASFQLSKDGSRILIPLSGRLYVVERAGGRVTELPDGGGFPIDPTFSPDGDRVAVVRDSDLYVIDLATLRQIRLTTRPRETIEHGVAEFVAQEEMDRHRGYWWSPDGRSIAYTEVDTEGLERFTIADPMDPSKPAQTWPYPRPGKPNAKVRLGVIPAEGGATTWTATGTLGGGGEWEYLARVAWDENSPLTVTLQNREQTVMLAATVDPATGSLTPVRTERDPAWVNIHQSIPKWLPARGGYLWITERGGSNALVWSRGVEEFTLASPSVEGLIAVDEERGTAYISAGPDPTEVHVWAVPLVSRIAPRALTQGRGVHGAVFGKNFQTFVVSASTLDGRRSWDVYTDGQRVGSLSSAAEPAPFMPMVELASVGVDPEFRAALIRPRDFDPSRRYPVLCNIYAGPTTTTVTTNLHAYLLDQWFADQGFVVVRIDNRGTTRRGRDWERAVKEMSANGKGNLIDLYLADQTAALAMLGARYRELDLARVGVYGWSFGGYYAAMAASRRPDVYHAAAAGAPVCSWEDYDTHYTERYLGTPQTNPEGYKASDVLTHLAGLRVPLLLIHGTADDNVYFMHSLKMADTLFRAQRPFEFLVLPGFTHMVPDPIVTRSLYGRMAGFFRQTLADR